MKSEAEIRQTIEMLDHIARELLREDQFKTAVKLRFQAIALRWAAGMEPYNAVQDFELELKSLRIRFAGLVN